MEKEHTYMAVGEPESSVILKYIRGTASEEEKAEVDLWLRNIRTTRRHYYKLPAFIMLAGHKNGLFLEIL